MDISHIVQRLFVMGTILLGLILAVLFGLIQAGVF